MESMPLIIFFTILVFFVLVGIHEWGHYYFARRAGILVREFAIGFGPKLFSFRRSETTFTFRLLPIGGFVQMAGEDHEQIDLKLGETIYFSIDQDVVTTIYNQSPSHSNTIQQGKLLAYDFIDELYLFIQSDEGSQNRYAVAHNAIVINEGRNVQIAPRNRLFSSKTVGQRALAIFAGPFMNFLLAFLLFMTVVFLIGVAKNVKIADVQNDSPASIAGLTKGDIVNKINGEMIEDDQFKLSLAISESLNKEMSWEIERNGKIETIRVTPTMMDGAPRIGIIIGSDRRTPSFLESIEGAWDYTVYVTKLIFDGFKRIILGQFAWDEIGGPVRTVSVTVEAAKAGFSQLVYWAAILSLYLGIFNLLPIPALDGSRLIFLAIEWVRGKPVEPRKESFVHFVGFAMLMGLMVVVTFHDIARFFK
jgi:regulator of sigma E protease